MSKSTIAVAHSDFVSRFRITLRDADTEGGVRELLSSSEEERRSIAPLISEISKVTSIENSRVEDQLWHPKARAMTGDPCLAENDTDFLFPEDYALGRRNLKDLLSRQGARLILLRLCVFACGTLVQAKSLDWAVGRYDDFLPLVKYTRPVWLQEWFEHVGEQTPYAYLHLKDLIATGLCTPPDTPRYILSLLLNSIPRPLAYVQANKIFQENYIWRLFEIVARPGSADPTLDEHDLDRSRPEEATWAYAFRALSLEGKVSREKLLRASLEALARDFHPRRAAWFSYFHDYMAPTPEERAALQPTYYALLSSSNPSTVTVVLNMVEAIEALHPAQSAKSGKSMPVSATSTPPPVLDLGAFIAKVGRVFALRHNGTTLAAAKLLERIANRLKRGNPALFQSALEAVAEGLVSEYLSVQERLAKTLRTHQEDLDPLALDAITIHRNTVQPSVGRILDEILQTRGSR